MLEEARLEKSRTGGEHWVLSIIVSRTPVRINLFGTESPHEIDSYIREALPFQWESGIAASLQRVSEQVVATQFQPEAVEKFNAFWRIYCLKDFMDNIGMRDKISYEEALQALREYFVEQVLDS